MLAYLLFLGNNDSQKEIVRKTFSFYGLRLRTVILEECRQCVSRRPCRVLLGFQYGIPIGRENLTAIKFNIDRAAGAANKWK